MTVRNWRTTVLGISAICVAMLNALSAMLDGNPATNPDWNTMIPLVVTGVLGLIAKDAGNVTTQADLDAAAAKAKAGGGADKETS